MSKIAASVYHTLRTYKYTRQCVHATEFVAILAGCFSVFVGWWERMSQTLLYSECHKPCSKLLDAFNISGLNLIMLLYARLFSWACAWYFVKNSLELCSLVWLV